MATTKQTTKARRTHANRARSGKQAESRRTGHSRPVSATTPNEAQVEELILQAVETELGGVQIYETAVSCAVNPELRSEWQKYLKQTKHHVEVITKLCNEWGIDAEKESPGRQVVRLLGESLVAAMEQAKASGNAEAAQLVAAECVVLAETKDHANWELLGEVAKAYKGEDAKPFKDAVDEVEDEEDEHLYHTQGWSRELWIDSLGLPAVLPPPEEKKGVKSAIAAARAKQGRNPVAKGSRK